MKSRNSMSNAERAAALAACEQLLAAAKTLTGVGIVATGLPRREMGRMKRGVPRPVFAAVALAARRLDLSPAILAEAMAGICTASRVSAEAWWAERGGWPVCCMLVQELTKAMKAVPVAPAVPDAFDNGGIPPVDPALARRFLESRRRRFRDSAVAAGSDLIGAAPMPETVVVPGYEQG